MKDAVVIKSYKNGLTLLINPEASQEEILADLEEKFSESRGFFGKAKMAVSMEGKTLSDLEQMQILDAIRRNSDLRIICIIGKDEVTEQRYIRSLEKLNSHLLHEESFAKIHKGSLTGKDSLDSDQTLIILGDVGEDCVVSSARNIIVLGALMGEAYAGSDHKTDRYVVALEMQPKLLEIGAFKYTAPKAKWGLKSKAVPKMAYVKEDEVVLEPLTKELLSTF